jgi:PLP dependent protein
MEPIATIISRLHAVKDRIARVAQSVGRPPDEITLLVASKTHPAERVREAWHAGQTIFGENYLQEALAKMPALADLPIEWHFIGPIQSNKTKRITENFVWVHSVDRIKIADRLAKDRPESLPPLQICLQVNVSGEDSKSGVAPEELTQLAAHVIRLPRLKLRGLMAVRNSRPPQLCSAASFTCSGSCIIDSSRKDMNSIHSPWGCRKIWTSPSPKAQPWYA